MIEYRGCRTGRNEGFGRERNDIQMERRNQFKATRGNPHRITFQPYENKDRGAKIGNGPNGGKTSSQPQIKMAWGVGRSHFYRISFP